MKSICALLLAVLLAGSVSAQVSADSSDMAGVTVIQKDWYMEVNNPAFEKSPFGPIEELQQTRQTRRALISFCL